MRTHTGTGAGHRADPSPRRGSESILAALAFAALLSGCGGEGERTALRRSVIENYASVVYASYEDSLAGVRGLRAAIGRFLDSPSAETLEHARAAWLEAREPYGQTEAYRFYGGPIDDAGGPETLINGWPVDEGYIDYVEGATGSGIINDPASYPTIDRDLLISMNEAGAEENISTGFHAIEFLLWGQDRSAIAPGDRPHTDYVAGESPNAARRAAYLRIAAELLIEHVEQVTAAWAPGRAGNYRSTFETMDAGEALRSILVGIGVLSKSELAGERMFTAYDNQDQEDEHSCFSDNTHRDIIANARGISNVYEGRYVRTDGAVIDGPGLDDLLTLVDPALASALGSLLAESLEMVERIPVPFDQAIVDPNNRAVVLETVYALQALGDRIAEGGTRLGLTINTALPE